MFAQPTPPPWQRLGTRSATSSPNLFLKVEPLMGEAKTEVSASPLPTGALVENLVDEPARAGE